MKTVRKTSGNMPGKPENAKEKYPGEQIIHKGVVSDNDVKEEVRKINIGDESKDRG